jgi:hypothetical protein
MPQNHQIHDGVLYINNVQPSDAGEYSCLGIGPTGTVLFTATAHLVVIGKLDSVIYIVGNVQFCGDMSGLVILEATVHLHSKQQTSPWQ